MSLSAWLRPVDCIVPRFKPGSGRWGLRVLEECLCTEKMQKPLFLVELMLIVTLSAEAFFLNAFVVTNLTLQNLANFNFCLLGMDVFLKHHR